MGFLDRFFGLPSIDQFARLDLKTLPLVGDDRQGTYDKESCRIVYTRSGKDAGMMNLKNIYIEYCNAPRKERAAMLRRYCATLAQSIEVPEDFEDAKPDLLPTVRPKSMLEVTRLEAEIEGAKWVEIPALPLSEHLVICFVYDLPNRLQFITQDNLDKWGVSPYEAGEVARHNFEEREFTLGSISEKLFVFATGDAFDATRMLLVERIRKLPLNGHPVAMPVTRDSLLITGADDVDGLGMMADLADKMREESRPVCPIPHIPADDGWEAWRLPADHLHFDKFRMLELKYLYGEYAEQKTLLDKRHEQTGEDVFVSTFSAIERDGKVLSWCVLSKGVNSAIPKTEFVALSDPDGKTRFAPWDRLQEVVGHRMQSLDCYPPRWIVNEFPSAAEIEQMQTQDWSK